MGRSKISAALLFSGLVMSCSHHALPRPEDRPNPGHVMSYRAHAPVAALKTPAPQIPPVRIQPVKKTTDVQDHAAEEAHHIVLRDTPEVRRYLRELTGPERNLVIDTLPRRALYIKMIESVFENHGIPHDLANLAFLESRFDPQAQGDGTGGMWQFNKETARSMGLEVSLRRDERTHPIKSTYAAAKYLLHLHAMFQDWFLVAAAYNYGPGKIERAIKSGKSKDLFDLGKRSLLCRDVVNFVAKFIAVSLICRKPDVYGFKETA